MQRAQTMNPFARRESHNKHAVLAYRTLTILTWLVVFALSVTFSLTAPPGGTKIWDQNKAHPSPFALSPVMTSVYWLTLLCLQAGYIFFLFTTNPDLVNAATNVGSHFILNNILLTAFIVLWVYSVFWAGELILIMNLFNLTSLYFRHLRAPRFVHFPVVSGPLVWTFIAIFWNGAAGDHSNTLAARLTANVAIWAILIYGLFFLGAFRDYAIGFEIIFLTASLALHQFTIKVIALQWIFAFVVMGLLLLATVIIVVPGFFGKELRFGGDNFEGERRPLLEDE